MLKLSPLLTEVDVVGVLIFYLGHETFMKRWDTSAFE
jgi:hypothetical protein